MAKLLETPTPTGHRVLMRHLAMQRGQGNEGMRKDVCTEHVVARPVVTEKTRNSSGKLFTKYD